MQKCKRKCDTALIIQVLNSFFSLFSFACVIKLQACCTDVSAPAQHQSEYIRGRAVVFVSVENLGFERTLSSLQQNQGVISQGVESEADHCQGFVHTALQSNCQHVRL